MERKQIIVMQRPVASHLPVPIVNNAVKTIGSVYKGGAPLRGLSKEDELKYMPKLLGIDEDDRSFYKEVRNFWLNVRIPVEGDGATLDVSTNDGEPTNIKDWVHYKFILNHPLVATSRDKLKSHQEFYLYDYDEEKRKENNMFKVKRKAFIELDKIDKDTDKMKMIYGILSDNDGSKLGAIDLSNELNSYVEEDPVKFLKVATDKKLETKAFIIQAINKNVLSKIGNQIFFVDEKLGDTLEEAVTVIDDKSKSSVKQMIKAKMEV